MSRQDVIQNAISFLSDPKVQASPLTQRIQFLEAKGLTNAEIDVALKQSTGMRTNSQLLSYPSDLGHPYLSLRPRWDWRDYFIATIFSGSITYGIVSLFQKFILPHLQTPTSSAYEEDRNALVSQFDAAESLLKELKIESASVRSAVEQQQTRIETTTASVEAIVGELREGETKTRDEMQEIREEVNTIREMLPKMIERNKENQSHCLAELQQELKSLKSLLLSRGLNTIPGSSTSTAQGKPTIPAWQLASSTNSNVINNSSSSASG